MSDSYRAHFAGHLRLGILRMLADLPGYRSNSSILRDALDGLGLPATRDRVQSELAWLAEQELVTCEQMTPSLTVAVATQRGVDVARGIAVAPGVQRPSPGA